MPHSLHVKVGVEARAQTCRYNREARASEKRQQGEHIARMISYCETVLHVYSIESLSVVICAPSHHNAIIIEDSPSCEGLQTFVHAFRTVSRSVMSMACSATLADHCRKLSQHVPLGKLSVWAF